MDTAELIIEPVAAALPAERARRAAGAALPYAVALVAVVLIYWSMDIVSPALPDLKDDLALSSATVGLVYSCLFVGRLLGNAPAAWLLARIGTAGTCTIGAVVLVAGDAWAAVTPGVGLLAPARVVQGVGLSLLINGCLRAILGARPGRGAAMTTFGMAATIGSVFGLQSGGYLTEHHGWRSVFVLAAILAGVVAAATFAARLTAGRQRGAVAVLVAAPAAPAMALRPMAPALAVNFLLFFNYGVFVAVPLYTEHAFGTSPEANARLLMVITVMHVLAALPAGRLIRTRGAGGVLLAGMLLAIAGTLPILAAPDARWIALPLVFYGAGQVAATNAAGDGVLHLGGQGLRAIGALRFSSDLGLVVGPYVTGALADRFGQGAPFAVLPAVMAAAAVVIGLDLARGGHATG